ncbi:calcium/calmodulin-dependent protein kinase I [Microdochium nivale]|nr:calcium/calmodulin-dependent protein kinase I [Microdochium nivale]
MAADPSLANVLQAWKLETEFHSNGEHHHKSYGGVDCWKSVKYLGGGAFGNVYQQQCQSGAAANTVRAVKHVSKRYSKLSERELMALITFSDMRIPEYANHFVSCLGWFEDTEHLYIAMEFMEHGDLQRYISNTVLSEPEAVQIVLQVAKGLQCMHQKGYVHRDLKPLNILVSRPGPVWHVKIADFGLSKNLDGTALGTHGIGTNGYVAPEQLDDRADSYTPAVDVFALGCIAYCLRTGRPPFQSPWPLMEYVRDPRCFPIEPLDDSSAKCARFIQSTMAARPGDRPSVEAILGHAWLGGNLSNRQRPSMPTPESSWGLSGAGSSSQWQNTFTPAQAAPVNPQLSPAMTPASSNNPWGTPSSATLKHAAESTLKPQFFAQNHAASPPTPPGSQRPPMPTTSSPHQPWPAPPWNNQNSKSKPTATPEAGSRQRPAKRPFPTEKPENLTPEALTGHLLALEEPILQLLSNTRQPSQASSTDKQQWSQSIRTAPQATKQVSAHTADGLYASKPYSSPAASAKPAKPARVRAAPPQLPPRLPPRTAQYAGAQPCEHWGTRKCQNMSKRCCECMDIRPVNPDGQYLKYVDGIGDVETGTRWEHYCPNCKVRGNAHGTTPQSYTRARLQDFSSYDTFMTNVVNKLPGRIRDPATSLPPH